MGKITPPAVLAHIKRFADECLQRGSESDSVYFGSVWLRYARWANEAKDRVRLDRGSFDALLPQHGFPVATKNRIRRVYGCSLAPEIDNRFSQRINEGAPMDIFDEIIATWRADVNRRADEVDALAASLTKSVEAWREAKRSVLQYELAARLGVVKPAPINVQDAGLAVLAACEAIPECAEAMATLRTQPTTPVAQVSASRAEAANDATQETAENVAESERPRDLPRVHSLAEAAAALNEPPVSVPTLAGSPLPMVIVGGVPTPEKLRWVKQSVPRVEWMEMPRTMSPATLISKIHGRRFSGVIVLELLSSDHADRIRDAAVAARLPHATARTAGQGQLREAMATLDAKLRCAA